MNVSPLAGKTDLVSVTVLVDGKAIPDTYRVNSVKVVREVNRIGTARITLTDGDPSTGTFTISEAATFVPGAKVEIKMEYHNQATSVFKGIVVKHGIRVREHGAAQMFVTCSDTAVKMTVGRKSNIYPDATDESVLKKLIQGHQLTADVESTSVTYKELVRYYSTDWDFTVSRAEVNGKLVLVDDAKVTVQSPAVAKECGLIVKYGDALKTLEAEIDARSQYTQVSTTAWDIAEQKVLSANSTDPTVNDQGNLTGSTLAGVLSAGTFELNSPAPLANDDLKQWADAQLLKSRLARIRGTVTFQGNSKAVPGKTIQLDGLGARFNGRAFIARVTHTVEHGNWLTEVGFGLSPRWFVEEQGGIEAPAAAGLLPGISGLQIGTVKKIDADPLTMTRVQLDLPLIDSEGKGIWARLGTPYATNGAGIQFMPEIGDEVMVGFINGDPRFPVVLGSLYSSKHTPPNTPDQPNTNKAIVTKGKIKITLQDVDKIVTIETPGGQKVVLSDKESSISITDSNQNSVKLSASGIALSSPKDISIKATGSVSIEGTAGVSIKSSASVTAEAPSVSADASASLKLKGTASAELTSPAQVTVKGAMVMIN
ncbi:type VI secretion system tip protein VgrG [Trinickia terrae]|uniref:Type VI secretion system tip protein VgrG n=1 Tax=Trinickia terrae TaxID=2571161 RepID=A0A4U1I5U2_9BURK|nr:type VI secretion system tip protein VgrG [Trinickia terrae]TKC88724.1 type VI secretion system tip protein VgrG [Trinickia terrae]